MTQIKKENTLHLALFSVLRFYDTSLTIFRLIAFVSALMNAQAAHTYIPSDELLDPNGNHFGYEAQHSIYDNHNNDAFEYAQTFPDSVVDDKYFDANKKHR